MPVADLMNEQGGQQQGGQQQGGQQQGGQQQGGQPWYSTHPDQQVRDLMGAKGYAEPHALATAYYHANKLISGAKDVVAIPAADAPQEQWDKFYGALGRPEKADAYTFKFAEGVKPHEGFVTFAKGLFHALGLPPARAQWAVDQWQQFAGKQLADNDTATKTANETAVAAIKGKYTEDVWKQHLVRGNEVIKKLGLDAAELNAIEANIGAAPLLGLIVKLSEKLGGEDTFRPDGGGGSPDLSTFSKEQAGNEIKRLQTDPAFMKSYQDKNAPDHKEAVEKMRVLYSKL